MDVGFIPALREISNVSPKLLSPKLPSSLRLTSEARHDKMVELVEQVLDVHTQLPKVKTPHEQVSLKRSTRLTGPHKRKPL